MIGSIKGTISHKDLEWALVSTSSGVGYKIYVTSEVLNGASLGEEVELQTHLVVREDNLSLYGFQNLAELGFFQQLIGISGVGPKLALSILNAGKVSELKSAIGRGEVAMFTMISGIGKKTAERIIVDLKGRVEIDDTPLESEDVLTALVGLGYNNYEVRKIIQSIPRDLQDTEEKIRYALKLLSK